MNIIHLLYMDNISNSAHKINQMYSDLTYFDQYGGSVFIFIILIIILFLIFAYTNVMKQIQPIKDDWVNQRCKPQVIPFAGLINKPQNMSTIDFTQQNFTSCMQDILTSISGYATQPISYTTTILSDFFNIISEAVQMIRTIISSIKSNMTSIAQEILGRIANIMVPLQQIIIAVVDTMEKVQGILTAGLYTSLGTYYTLKALLGAIIQFIIIILIVLSALILCMWIIPFSWPIAATMTAIFISISIPLAIIVAFMTDVLHIKTDLSIPSIPSRPSCFDKNTNIKMNDGTSKNISDIEVGEKLYNNVLVTAKIKINATNVKMYSLNNTIVSGSHRVKYNGVWVYILEHPKSILIMNYKEPIIYCLNTSSKEIEINGLTYIDWDEIFEDELNQLSKMVSEKNKEKIDTSDIHKYFDGGFSGTTKITLLDKTKREIKDIKVGDILNNSEYVYATVEIYGNDLSNQYNYNLGKNTIFTGGPNLITALDLNINNKIKIINNKENKLYHLITDTESFYVNDIKFYHYNSSIELFLDKSHAKLLSMKYV